MLRSISGGGSGAQALATVPSGDSSGTPGNATINARSGRFAMTIGTNSVTITNNTVTPASHVFLQLSSVPELGMQYRALAGAGFFTVTLLANSTVSVVFEFLVVS